MGEYSISFAVLAQLVEQGPEKSRVPRSIRGDSTIQQPVDRNLYATGQY